MFWIILNTVDRHARHILIGLRQVESDTSSDLKSCDQEMVSAGTNKAT